jgi:hypothetical protein
MIQLVVLRLKSLFSTCFLLSFHFVSKEMFYVSVYIPVLYEFYHAPPPPIYLSKEKEAIHTTFYTARTQHHPGSFF